MNHRDTPYLRLIVPFILGIALGGRLDVAPVWLPFVLLATIFCTLFLAIRRYKYRNRWIFGLVLYSCLFIGGYWLVVQHNELRLPGHFKDQITTNPYLLCQAYEAPTQGQKIRIPVRVLAVGASADSLSAVSGNLLILLEPSPLGDSLRYGDQFIIQGQVQPAEAVKNPEAFDYRRYLNYQNIHYQCFAKKESLIKVSSRNGNGIWELAYNCRDRLLKLLQQYFPTQNEYAVASALMLGYKEDLSDELRDAYAATGSMHALAVSGTHVGMLYMGLFFLTQRLQFRGRWRRLETFLILLAIWGFTFLTGATASVMRASVMFSVYMLGKAFWRNASAWNVLPASAFGLLLYNPYFLFDVGFQLSYAAVAGMVFFYPRLYKLFPPGPRWADEGLKVLLVGVAAQLGTLPFSLFYFHQFPVYFWLSGWIVVLGGAMVLWGGGLLILLDAVSQTLAHFLGEMLYFMLSWLNRIIVWIQHLPGAVVPDIWIPDWVVLALYASISFLGVLMVRRKGRWLVAFLALFVLLGLFRISSLSEKSGQQRVTIYHMGKQLRLIDFFDGRQAYAFSDTLSSKQEDFAAKSHRIASGIYQKTRVMLQDTCRFIAPNLWFDKPFFQFYQQKFVLLDGKDWPGTTMTDPVPVDAVILSGNPDLRIADCRAAFPCNIIVFDNSNSSRKVAQWRQECQDNQWPFHDIRTQGAWVSQAR